MPLLSLSAGKPRVTLSVVSHGHGTQVLEMLQSFASSGLSQWWSVDAIVTLNIPEPALEAVLQPLQPQDVAITDWPFPIRLIKNSRPLGFGANHNQALRNAASDWFCIVNPDILWCAPHAGLSLSECESTFLRWPGVAMPKAQASAPDEADATDPVGVYVPVQVSPQGQRQDFARKLPLPWVLASRVFCRLLGQGAPTLGAAPDLRQADWVNGACMLMSAPVFRQLGGFDTRYFMYGEDVDICLRLQLQGYTMAPIQLEVVHDARRNTVRQWRHLGWHVRSLLRLWCSATFWRYVVMRHRLRQR